MHDFPPREVILDPTQSQIRDPAYLSSLPMVPAYGFPLCMKLGQEDPSGAVQNADSAAFLALGKPDSSFVNRHKVEILLIRLDSRSLPQEK